MTNVLTVVISELMADLLVDFPVTTEQSACVPVARKKTQTDSGGLQRVRIYCRSPGKGV